MKSSNNQVKILEMILNYNDIVTQVFDQVIHDAKMLTVHSEGKEVIPAEEYIKHVAKVKIVVLDRLSKVADIKC